MLGILKRKLGQWLAQHFRFYRQTITAYTRIEELNQQVSTLQAEQARHQQQSEALWQLMLKQDPLSTAFQQLRRLAPDVEFYQPLYRLDSKLFFPEQTPQRPCLDRADAMFKACGYNVTNMRILDVGSSLGFFSFYFADRGAYATGLESHEKNVLVSEQVKTLNRLPVEFVPGILNLEFVAGIPEGRFESALILSVLHHVVHFQGLEYTQKLVKALMEKIPVLFVELALKTETVDAYWVPSQPEDPLDVFALCPDVRIEHLGDFPNHLSPVQRPLYKITRQGVCLVNNQPYPYTHMTTRAYASSPMGANRNYYSSDKVLIKEYYYDSMTPGAGNRMQIVREIGNFLNIQTAPEQATYLPRMLDFEIQSARATLVLEKITGELLSDKLAELTDERKRAILADVVAGLNELRTFGLFHNDLRCWNILLDDKKATLIDLGLASSVENESVKASLLWLMGEMAAGKVLDHGYPRTGEPFATMEEYGAAFAPVVKYLRSTGAAVNLAELGALLGKP